MRRKYFQKISAHNIFLLGEIYSVFTPYLPSVSMEASDNFIVFVNSNFTCLKKGTGRGLGTFFRGV